MIRRARLLVALGRPPVFLLLAMFCSTGLASGGRGDQLQGLLRPMVVVVAFLVFSVAVNDLADEAIDRVNLPGAAARPLVTGTATRREMTSVAAGAGVLALAAGMTIRWQVVLVVAGGLVLSAAYSLPPARLSGRGVLASLLLPGAYVAVPFLVGAFCAAPTLTIRELAVMSGLYVGFIGRILLKDFRDVRGDALFGKRTFLVRHGRRPTCALSLACWLVGSAALAISGRTSPAQVAAFAAFALSAVVFLRALSSAGGARRDERLIAALAIVGRGAMLVLLAGLDMAAANWPALAATAAVSTLTAVTLGQARAMVLRGPLTRCTVPESWALALKEQSRPEAPREPPLLQAGLPVLLCAASPGP